VINQKLALRPEGKEERSRRFSVIKFLIICEEFVLLLVPLVISYIERMGALTSLLTLTLT
jgi:hypothetical protein